MLKNLCQEINGYWYASGLPVSTNFETSILFVEVLSENGFCLLSWDKFCKIYKLLTIPVISSYSTYFLYKYYVFLKWCNHTKKLII